MSYSDIVHRKIPNRVSILLIGIAVCFSLLFSSLNVLESVTLGFLILILAELKIIGGGDAKAFIFTALLLPARLPALAIVFSMFLSTVLIELEIRNPPLVPIYQLSLLSIYIFVG